MYRVFGGIPGETFDTREEAEAYIKKWRDGCEGSLYIVMAYSEQSRKGANGNE